MKKIIMTSLVVLATAGLIAATCGDVYAKKGGKGKHQYKEKTVSSDTQTKTKTKTKVKSSTPPGWSRGRKVGWRGKDYPPGWSKWNEEERTEWMHERDEAVRIIDNEMHHYHFTTHQSYEVIGAFDNAVAGGMAINDARKKLISGIKDSSTRKNLMIDGAQTALELLR